MSTLHFVFGVYVTGFVLAMLFMRDGYLLSSGDRLRKLGTASMVAALWPAVILLAGTLAVAFSAAPAEEVRK